MANPSHAFITAHHTTITLCVCVVVVGGGTMYRFFALSVCLMHTLFKFILVWFPWALMAVEP